MFRAKPLVVKAVQLRWDTWTEMCTHAGVGALTEGRPQGCYVDPETLRGVTMPVGDDPIIGLHIPTPEGLMLATQGDWIVRGVYGELSVIKPNIFATAYEPVDLITVSAR